MMHIKPFGLTAKNTLPMISFVDSGLDLTPSVRVFPTWMVLVSFFRSPTAPGWIVGTKLPAALRSLAHLLDGFGRVRLAWRMAVQVKRPAFSVAPGLYGKTTAASAQWRGWQVFAQRRYLADVLVAADVC
jgi:hypothetical protein